MITHTKAHIRCIVTAIFAVALMAATCTVAMGQTYNAVLPPSSSQSGEEERALPTTPPPPEAVDDTPISHLPDPPPSIPEPEQPLPQPHEEAGATAIAEQNVGGGVLQTPVVLIIGAGVCAVVIVIGMTGGRGRRTARNMQI